MGSIGGFTPAHYTDRGRPCQYEEQQPIAQESFNPTALSKLSFGYRAR
jgi:hypothetical protein